MHWLVRFRSLVLAPSFTPAIITAATIASAFVVRFWLSLHSLGSNDAHYWLTFAQSISSVGLMQTYEEHSSFNHPPLMGWLSMLALRATERGLTFPFWMRVLPILGDALSVLLVWLALRGTPTRARVAAVLTAWSPVAILVSAYHCNTDALLASLCVLSCFLLEARRPFWAGIALAGALNVKVVPLILIPALLSHCTLRGRRALQFMAGGSLAAIPFAPLFIANHQVILRNVFSYNSNFDNWGFSLLVRELGLHPGFEASAAEAQVLLVQYGRYAIVASVLLLASWNAWAKRLNAYELGAATFALFLVLTPGFGLQYTIYPVALLIIADVRWGAAYSLFAGAFIAAGYYLFFTHVEPWESLLWSSLPMPALGVLAWGLLGAFIVVRVRQAAPTATPLAVDVR